MKNRTIHLLALTLGLTAALACSPDGAGEEQQTGEHQEEAHEGGVALSDAELEEFGVELSVAGPGLIATTVELPGEIRPNEDLVAHIVPRFPGIVKSVRKAIGDLVSQGDVLVVVESSESLSTYSVKSLLEGVVIARHVSIGESVTTEREVFVVADLSEVWVDISVYQKHLSLLHIGQAVRVSLGHHQEEASGVLSYVAPIVDEETRTATARLVLPNPDGVWRPGLFVTASVVIKEAEVPIAVPNTAVEIVEEKQVIFVQDEDGLEPRTVTLGRRGGRFVEVLSGLSPGQRYVSSGGFTVKSELTREELSGSHAH